MSYCRFGRDSDVYCYRAATVDAEPDRWVCCGCSLGADATEFPTVEGLLIHLEAHRAAGDKVPEPAMERCRAELAAERAATPCAECGEPLRAGESKTCDGCWEETL